MLHNLLKLIFLLSFAVSVFAEQPISELPSAEVLADHSTENKTDYTEIKSESWEGKNLSLADILAEIPGIQTRRTGGMGSFQTVSIRGMQGNNIAIAIDGVVAQNFNGGAIDLGSIDINQYERIEIYKGNIPARFGANAIGGLINLVSKDATSRSGKFSASLGSYGARTLSMQAGAPIIDSIYWNSTINYRAAKNDFPFFNRNGTLYNSEDDFWDNRENAEFSQISGNHIFRFVHGKKNSRLRIEHHNSAGGIAGREEQQTEVANSTSDGILLQYEIEPEDLSLYDINSGTATRDWSWFLRAFGGFEKNKTFWYFPLDKIGPSSRESLTSGALTKNGGVQGAIFSKGILFNERTFWNAELHSLFNYSRLNSRNDSKMRKYEFSNTLGQLSFAGELKPLYFFSIKADASGRFSKDKTEDGKVYAVSMGENFEDSKRFLHSERISVNFDIITAQNYEPLLSTFAALGHYYRAPSLTELFSTGFGILPNPNLKEETGEQAEAGIAYTAKKTKMSLTAFSNRIRDKINYITSFGLSKPINQGRAKVHGLEAELYSSLFNWLAINSNATFQKPGDLPNEPKEKYNASVIFKLPLSFELFMGGEAHSVLYRDQAQTMRIPSNAFYNTGLTYKPLKTITISLFVRNLLNTEEPQSIYDAYPIPGRTFTMSYIQEF